MTEQEEHLLISKVILYNDHKAFNMLLTYHQNGIKNLLIKLLDFNESAMDDLFQESCTKIYRSMKQYKGTASFSTWVYRITYNTFINYYNRKKRRTYDDTTSTALEQQSHRAYIRQDMKMDMERMISVLRPEEKAAIQLSYIMGFTHRDIALIMDCPIGTVKSLIKRGKERIAIQFKNYKS